MARIVFDDSRSIADMLHSKENRRTSFAVFNKMIEEGAFWVSETITQKALFAHCIARPRRIATGRA